MSSRTTWQKRIADLTERSWPVADIRARLQNLQQNGFGTEDSDWQAMQANREDVLDRVQLRAEEYEY